MKHFEEVLQIINGRKIELIEATPLWDFWSVEYKTPSRPVLTYYLYLKAKCPLKEASESGLRLWQNLSNNKGYEVVVTPKSSLTTSLDQTNKHFKGQKIWTSKRLIEDYIFADLKFIPNEEEANFIDPDIELSSEEIKNATEYLTKWFIAPASINSTNSLGILRANAGVGKTTLARILPNIIHKRDTTIIPILVESEQWRFHLQSDIQLANIWDKAISARFKKALPFLSNERSFQVLIREGIFPIIFDGFDELCLNPYLSYTPESLIENFLEILKNDESSGNARILLTTRETFWQSIYDNIDTKHIDFFRLRGFSNDKRQRYFQKRLSNPVERDIALRIASQISGKLYDDMNVESINIDRPSGVPFILDMIASHVKDNPDPDINPYQTDPLADLIEAICRRENVRQTLNIDHNKQIEIFEELFREHNEEITLDDLRFYLECYCDIHDEGVINRFTNHFFLLKMDRNKFSPRYEVLKIYFIARFLAKGLVDITRNTDRKKFCEVLAKNFTGSTQLLDWLVGQLARLDKPRLIQAVNHALAIINDRVNITNRKNSGMAIFNVINMLIHESDKKIRLQQLSEYLKAEISDTKKEIKNIVMNGNIRSFDFSGFQFVNCIIVNADFKNCIFNSSTLFKSCDFEDSLKFTSCDGEADIKTEQCKYSQESEYCFDQLQKKQSRSELKQSLAEDVLRRALKKFKGQYGYTSIQSANQLKGLPQSNPYRNMVWDILIKNGVVKKHELSKTSDIGLHLTDDHDIRKEVITFLDNGYLGSILRKVLSDMIGKI